MPPPLKVLFISQIFPTPVNPTKGVFSQQLVQGLMNYCDVRVVCPQPWFPRLPRWKYLERWHGYSLIPTEYDVDAIPVLSPKYPFIPKLGDRYHSFLFFLGLVRYAFALKRRFRFDVINAHWLYPDGVAAARLARIVGVPLVLSGLGCDVNMFLFEKRKRGAILRALKQASRVTVVSEELKAHLLGEGINHEHVTVIRNGVNKQLFYPRDQTECASMLGLPQRYPCVVFVGRLAEEEEKGLRYLIEAFQKLVRVRKGVTLYVIGDGPMLKSYKDLVHNQGLQEQIRFVGAKAHQDIPLWIGACDVFCLPSLREGCPNVVLEALSCGRPVVASDVGDIPNLIGKDNGLLVDAGNSQQLCEALENALGKKWNQAEICASVSTLTWDAAASQYYSVLHGSCSDV
ncbi:glycosyltransferase family 4 protein [Candidatus Nitrospira allomarina]|uniref:Glycosyltransferase family 4 protein n=1 Tax=Candidatus Nitrospira allomarina TaxID=3020900 RepID=A0AA96JWI1_9BACT|nr:glycosyltransferase family 4 protein [Candidatus Nitrospira allomarina]WNM57916.1 glycosyltransferase family 4 protein [Candidatus Nitrospira allomarina]